MKTPKRIQMESAPEAWRALAGPGYPAPILEMHSRGDTQVYLLRNTLLPPYKAPPLPCAALSPKVHDLLSQLKLAQAFLVESFWLAQQSLPDSYRDVRAVHTVEMPLPIPERHQRYKCWAEKQFPEPCLVAALELVTRKFSHYFLSLDLSPLHPPKRRHPEGIPKRTLASLALASRHYNDAVQTLFDAGIVVFPSYFFFDLGEAYLSIHGVPEWAMMFDI